MIIHKSRKLLNWYFSICTRYRELKKTNKQKRCKIVGIECNPDTLETTLFVLISGIKSQIIPYSPEKLVTEDAMLNEFSAFDVRAITFYALKKTEFIQNSKVACSIAGQDFLNGKTIFIIKDPAKNSEERKSAHELYCDNNLLAKFSYDDLKIIIMTAIQEQSIKDDLSMVDN